MYSDHPTNSSGSQCANTSAIIYQVASHKFVLDLVGLGCGLVVEDALEICPFDRDESLGLLVVEAGAENLGILEKVEVLVEVEGEGDGERNW